MNGNVMEMYFEDFEPTKALQDKFAEMVIEAIAAGQSNFAKDGWEVHLGTTGATIFLGRKFMMGDRIDTVLKNGVGRPVQLVKHVPSPEKEYNAPFFVLEGLTIVGARDAAHADRLWEVAYELLYALACDGEPRIRLAHGVHRVALELYDGKPLVATCPVDEHTWCMHVDGVLLGWVDTLRNVVYAA